MSKREIYEQKTEEILNPIMEELEFELVDVEYVKEGSMWYLRAYIDKPGGITVNDCEAVSRRLSDILDEKDFIEDSYVLEVTGLLDNYDYEAGTVTIELEDGTMKTFEKGDIALIRLAFDF